MLKDIKYIYFWNIRPFQWEKRQSNENPRALTLNFTHSKGRSKKDK